MRDLSKSGAAKRRFCCVCGKYCKDNDIYFPEKVMCLRCYSLQDYKPFFITVYYE
jgi:hypothetical protein